MAIMRPPGRILAITRHLRARIRDRTWPPGARLPNRRELAAELDAPEATVQEAVGRLVAEGSLATRKRAGTVVAARPPELHRIAIVLPSVAARQPTGNLYRDAVAEAADAYGSDISLHDELDPALRARVLGDGLAGLLVFGNAGRVVGLTGHGPAVAVVAAPGELPAGLAVTCIVPDNRSLFEVGVAELLRRGRRRIAVLATAGILDAAMGRVGTVERTLARLAELGAATPAPWLQLVDPLEPRWVAQTVALLLSVRPRLEAMLLLDDHLGEPVRRAVGRADVLLAVHTNRPDPAGRGLHIGCTAGAMVAAGVAALRCGRAPTAPRLVHLPATLVAEIPG